MIWPIIRASLRQPSSSERRGAGLPTRVSRLSRCDVSELAISSALASGVFISCETPATIEPSAASFSASTNSCRVRRKLSSVARNSSVIRRSVCKWLILRWTNCAVIAMNFVSSVSKAAPRQLVKNSASN